MNTQEKGAELLAQAGITVNGSQPWDIQVHNEKLFGRVLREGRIAIGESYMDGWWDVEDMAEFFSRLLRSEVGDSLIKVGVLGNILKARIFNRQSRKRAWQVGEEHYDVGNDLYKAMLGKSMAYTCAYWKDAKTLDEAQEAKLDLICRKIGVKKGDRILDLGGGWASFATFAAERYGAEVVVYTISREQAELGRERSRGLPVEIRLDDYRNATGGPYDHVVAIGIIEHVGYKNYKTLVQKAASLLKEDGLFLLHGIGTNKTTYISDPWFDKYIFPNGTLPSVQQIGRAIEGAFVMEDWHNIGADYDRTLLEWWKSFDAAWPHFEKKYGKRFYRMWRYYLLSIAGAFRSRANAQLWQIVLSKKGVYGGYTSVR